MAHHDLPSTPETVHWGYFEAARAPVLDVASGDTVTMHCLSGEPKDLPGAPFEVLPPTIARSSSAASVAPVRIS